jgi:hypothetical protein
MFSYVCQRQLLISLSFLLVIVARKLQRVWKAFIMKHFLHSCKKALNSAPSIKLIRQGSELETEKKWRCANIAYRLLWEE